jgi:hypothetical protein
MSTLATIVAVAALLGAVASWIVGAVNFVRTLRVLSGQNNQKQMWYAIFAWPFASRQMTGEAAAYSSNVNKSLVAFFTCMMIAITAISLATNLSRLSR